MDAEAERLAALRDVQARFAVAVREGRFEDARSLEARRFVLIDALVRARPAPDTVRELGHIAAADRALLPQLQDAHTRCGNELRDLQRARQAARAYGT